MHTHRLLSRVHARIVRGLGLIALAWLLSACPDTQSTADSGGSSTRDIPERGRPDLRDGGIDSSRSDLVVADVPPDLAPDRAPDAESDAVSDAAADAMVDAVVDAVVDTRGDAEADTGPADVEGDVRTDAVTDVASDPTDGDAAFDVLPDKPPADLTLAEPDMSVLADADAVVDAVEDASLDVVDEPDAGPPPTPPIGVYDYDRLFIGGLEYVEVADFHPDGSYFVLLERRDIIHVYDMESGTDLRFDPISGADEVLWEDMVFAPDGSYALLVGEHESLGGVVYRFDDAVYRALGEEDDPAAIVTRYEAFERNTVASVVRFPPDGGDPIVVTGNETGGGFWANVVWSMDVETGEPTLVASLGGVQGLCRDADYVSDLAGNPGILLTCNLSILFYWWNGGVGEWDSDIRTPDIGNMGGLAAHPSGDYALLVASSGRRVHWFERGLMNARLEAAPFCNREIDDVEFQPNGQRALIYGGVQGTTDGDFAVAIEYRHPLYCEEAGFCSIESGCAMTEVSVFDFFDPPYGADSSYHFSDAAWSRRCDGGILVGGKSNFSTNIGLVVRFEVLGGRPCW